MEKEIKDCPFCGSNDVEFRDNTFWTGKSNQILSVTLNHFCIKKNNQSFNTLLSFKGKTIDEVISIWNNRIEN